MSLLLLAVALTLSSVAAFYSIVGLAYIFSGAYVAVVIMGTALEVAKVLTTVWLHKYWSSIPLLLKSYLTSAVIVLMLITSMGIFGFLSKAHLEQSYAQASLEASSEAIVDTLNTLDAQIQDANARIDQLSSNQWFDEIKLRIDAEQLQLSTLQQQRADVQSSNEATNNQLQSEIAEAELLLSTRKISALQTLLGLRADGSYGASTSTAYEQYIATRQAKLAQDDTDIFDTQIEQAQARINKLQSQLVPPEQAKAESDNYKAQIIELSAQRADAAASLADIQKQINAFAAEVGPITFISELFFDETDETSKSATIRILILVIIVVFDPLAILLVVAASMTIIAKPEVVDDQLPPLARLQELIAVRNDMLVWKERNDKSFDARWANKALGKTATIDGKSYKTAALLNKLKIGK